MDIETRIKLIENIGQETVTQDDLRTLLETKKHPVAYDGFEPSGVAHLPFVVRALNISDLLKAGVKFKLFLADWHAYLNNKMGGDIENIRKVGLYFTEVYKALGVDFNKVELIWAKDIMDQDYMERVLKISKETSINRMLRCTTIMGRTEKDSLSTGQLIYPAMQCADIFKLDVDICQLGLDQRRINMLAREVGPKLGWWKPVVISHPMLMGLKPTTIDNLQFDENSVIDSQIQMKMSKSKPETCIYIHDSKEDIVKKIKNAYCPEKVVENNPMLDYAKGIIFKKYDVFKIERPDKFGGDLEVLSYDELEKLFVYGKIHPLDLKNSVAFYLNELISPAREHFEKNKKAAELYEIVKTQKITR
ncbi:MAG: tyrosine--tRNA ligase [DPANN group archaeon]|nr:tyrosine--tRNA ligase [DPANN group archaeon]